MDGVIMMSEIASRPICKIIENYIIRYTHLLDSILQMSKTGDFFSEPEWPSLDGEPISNQLNDKDTPNSLKISQDSNFNEYSLRKDCESHLKDQKQTTIDHSHYESQSKTQRNLSFSVNDDVHIEFYDDEKNDECKQEQPSLPQSMESMVLPGVKLEYEDIKIQQNGIKMEEDSWEEGFTSKEKPPKYRILCKEFKEFLVRQAEVMTIAEVSRIYNVSVNNICRWKKSCDRKAGAGRKITNLLMEKRLLAWITSQGRDSHGMLNANRKQIQKKALQFADDESFKASKGWFERFAKRNKDIFQEEVKPKATTEHNTRRAKELRAIR